MKAFGTAAVVAAALALTACNKSETTEDANTAVVTEMEANDMADMNAVDVNMADANAAASGLDGTGNPIGPGAPAGSSAPTN